ncbi:MAG: shikimate kinase [Prevotellaceae bacterium]|jgi:shikimate kinase|nr:shikimate kinase [Prevotellaceae bacterium]
MLVFLIGFMGSGKTTLGRALSKQLDWRFIDLDREIEKFSGCSVSQLFSQSEESGFRKIEQQVLYNVVNRIQNQTPAKQNCIISCGGGAPCYEQNLTFMKSNGFVIYLEVSPEILCERLLHTSSTNRPLLPSKDPSNLLIYIRNLLTQRLPYYKAAHWEC